MYRLFARSEAEDDRLFARSEAEDDEDDEANQANEANEANGTVIDLTGESVGETKDGTVIDLTGESVGETKEPTLPYFERQVKNQCTLHSINNAIGYKLIEAVSICESKQGKKDRLGYKHENGMYSVAEAAETVTKNSNGELQVVRLDKLFETPEKMLTFDLLEYWTIDSENPRVKNIIIMWQNPYFHMIALRYFEKKWFLLDSETTPVSLDRAKFDSKMANKDAVLTLQFIYTIVPKTQQTYDHHCPNPDDPIELE